MASNARPPLRTADTLDAAELSGTLASDGSAVLQANGHALSNGTPTKLRSAPETFDGPAGGLKEDVSDTSEEDYESYEAQQVQPDTIVEGSAGGQLGIVSTDGQQDKKHSLGSRRGSIPIRLERTDRKGRYLLTADDPEIKDIIRRSFQRQRDAGDSGGKAKTSKLRDLVFTRRFTTFDRFNPSNTESPFQGFYVLFWLAMAFLLVRVCAKNYRDYGSILGENQLLRMMFGKELIDLAITDSVMFLATAFGVGLQRIIVKGHLSWDRSGWILQNLWQTFYLGAVVGWTFYREWPWTHSIFIVLHGLVFVMKQHSYAFYNGYLSQVHRRRQLLEKKRDQLDAMSPVSSPVASPVGKRNSTSSIVGEPNGLRHRRHKSLPAAAEVTNLSSDSDEVASVAAAISANQTLDQQQLDTFRKVITSELDALDVELQGKCSVTKNYYPSNLTLFNWAEWTFMPTLVYELEYPRQDKIDWGYVAEKTGAIFGVLIIMQTISQAYIYPPMREAVILKERGISLDERWQEFPYLVLDMLFPLLLEQLLTWYLIWECVLNVLAELTYFADRGFYGNWWSSVSWDQYARDWNRPVHNFLLRHVYHSSISAFHLSKSTATFMTFLLSALVHELLMFVLFKKVRGYLFTAQLTQMPLVMLSRTKFLKGRNVLGNLMFWLGLFIGPAFLTSLYLIV